VEWPNIARRQGGAISRGQLQSTGLADRAITRLTEAGALERARPGVFVVRGAPITYVTRLWIAVLGCRGVLGFATAAHLHGFDTRPDLIHVIRSDLDHLARPPGVRLHRVALPDDAVAELAGLPITTPVWSLLDHLGRLPAPNACRLADRALQRGWLTTVDIERRVREFAGRQGNKTLRRILTQCADGAAAESERLLHKLLRDAGIAGWRANHRVQLGDGVFAVVDVAFIARKVAVEVDGWAFHSDVERFQRDRERQNRLVALGWTVLRFTWADLTQRPDYVLHSIMAAVGHPKSTSRQNRT
jgi:very-short-patch-repair endonuclease